LTYTDQANVLKTLRSARADLAAMDRAIAGRVMLRSMLQRLAAIRQLLTLKDAFANLQM
jgi:hypothetical protein